MRLPLGPTPSNQKGIIILPSNTPVFVSYELCELNGQLLIVLSRDAMVVMMITKLS
jgi:hypothetical protein